MGRKARLSKQRGGPALSEAEDTLEKRQAMPMLLLSTLQRLGDHRGPVSTRYGSVTWRMRH